MRIKENQHLPWPQELVHGPGTVLNLLKEERKWLQKHKEFLEGLRRLELDDATRLGLPLAPGWGAKCVLRA